MPNSSDPAPWIARRLRQTERAIADSNQPSKEACAQGWFSRTTDGHTFELCENAAELCRNAWRVWGRHVPAPSPQFVALLPGVLSRCSALPDSAQDWVLFHIGNRLKKEGWRANKPVLAMTGLARNGQAAGYFDWLSNLLLQSPSKAVRGYQSPSLARTVMDHLFRGISLPNVISKVQSWDSCRRISTAAAILISDMLSRPLLQLDEETLQLLQFDDLTAQHLWNRDLVRTEGATMQHCVASRFTLMRMRQSIVLSIMRGKLPIATAVFEISRESSKFTLDECQGPGNIAPHASVLHFAERIRKTLNTRMDSDQCLAEYKQLSASLNAIETSAISIDDPRISDMIPKVEENQAIDVVHRAWDVAMKQHQSVRT